MFDQIATFITVLFLALFIMVFLPVAFGQVAEALLNDINCDPPAIDRAEPNKQPLTVVSVYRVEGEFLLDSLPFGAKRRHTVDERAYQHRANAQHPAQEMMF